MKLKNIMSKRITMYLAIAILAIGLLQCKKEENPSPPTITVTTPSEANPIAYPGKYMQLSLKATADAANGAELSSIEVKRKFETENAEIPLDESISGSEYTLDGLSIQVEDQEGTETWTITVTDNKGQQTVKTINITIQGNAPDLAPEILFAGGTHIPTGLPYRNVNFTIDINKKFVIGILAKSNTDSQAELERFVVKKAVGSTNPVTILDTTFTGSQFTWDGIYFSNYQPAIETYIFRITDVNGEVSENNIIVTTQQADMGIFIFEGKHLGSYTSGVDAGFNTVSGNTYDVHTIPVELEAEVEFVFFHDAGFGKSLMSPENPYLFGMFPAINNWETQNKTLFQKTTFDNPAEDYDYIANKNQLILAMQNLAGIGNFTVNYYSEIVSQPGGFEVNDIFAFQNSDGNRGLMVIREIDEGATPGATTIIFDMKVEKP